MEKFDRVVVYESIVKAYLAEGTYESKAFLSALKGVNDRAGCCGEQKDSSVFECLFVQSLLEYKFN